jgi:hypothetical protein
LACIAREVNKLKAEGDILKGRGLLREESDMKFVFVAKHRNIWPGRRRPRLTL